MEMYLPVYWQCPNNLRLDVTQEFWDLEFLNSIWKKECAKPPVARSPGWQGQIMEERRTHEEKLQVFPCETRTAEVWGVSPTPAQRLYGQTQSASAGEDLQSEQSRVKPIKEMCFFFSFPLGLKNYIPFFRDTFGATNSMGILVSALKTVINLHCLSDQCWFWPH